MTTPPMSPERWRTIDAILQLALASDPAGREALVADACAGDEALRREVMSLLALEAGATDFLERPAVEALVGMESTAERLARALAPHYAIAREIAHGGMATVYLARDLRHHRHVAIKVLRQEIADAVAAERFLEEIRVTASLQHPHILPLFDSGSADGLLWYAMPFVEGESLRLHLARVGRMHVQDAVRLTREVADALHHAHARGIVHRDVKPENVLLRDGHALVADFGIALALEEAGGERLTRTGLALGTPQYMAPEQAAGARALDARVDVYALGAVLHEMLAGEPPFAAATRQAVVQRLMYDPPTSLAAYRRDVAPWIDAAVRRALSKNPADRFTSAGEFAAALGEPTVQARERTGEGSGARRARTVSARLALQVAGVALVLGLVLGVAIGRTTVDPRVPDVAPAMSAIFKGGDGGAEGSLVLAVVDRAGRPLQSIDANRPWTPRFSPDGRRVAYGAFGSGRQTSDVWVTELEPRTTRRITDDDADSNDPQWSPDGTRVVYAPNAPAGKDLVMRALDGTDTRPLASRDGSQMPNDWLRDGGAVVATEDAGRGYDIIVQPVDGSPARALVATPANETSAKVSYDGRWVAYTSDASGRAEVYLDSFTRPGRAMRISTGGGVNPVWRADGRELYYWRDGALVAVAIGAPAGTAVPAAGAQTELFRAPYQVGINAMYDVSRDGKRFVLVRQR